MYVFLIIIIVVAMTLRVWDLDNVGFNGDEAVYGGQAATLAGYQDFAKSFSIYRAHPLLLQFIVSLFFVTFGVTDTIGRIAPVIFGVLSVLIVYLIGKELYDKKVALTAALVVAVLPYHIIISRQVLLDVPLSFFSTLTLYFVIRHLKARGSTHWLYLIGASSGLTFLSKEVGIFALMASIIGLILTKRLSLMGLLIIGTSFLLATAPFWIPILTIKEAQQTALSYWQWQTSRDQNQPDTFYMSIIFREALGYFLTGLLVLSLFYLWRIRHIRNPKVIVLLTWIGVTLILFQFLPIKGFHFAQSLVPPFVLLGVWVTEGLWNTKIAHYRIIIMMLVPLILLSSGTSINYLFKIDTTPLAGSGGIPLVREGAVWIKNNIPDSGILLTLDAPTANIIKFYSNNEVFSLHSNRNPAYTEIVNPDLFILNGQINYLVSQPYMAENYPHLRDEVDQMNDLVIKYGGIPVHTVNETYYGKNGEILIRPAIIIYALNGIKGN